MIVRYMLSRYQELVGTIDIFSSIVPLKNERRQRQFTPGVY